MRNASAIALLLSVLTIGALSAQPRASPTEIRDEGRHLALTKQDCDPNTELCWPYNFHAQVLAQAICTSAKPSPSGLVFAVPRTCPTKWDGETCEQLCMRLFDGERSIQGSRCFESVHIYAKNGPAGQLDVLGLKTRTYSNCDHKRCGPNYCCCG